MDLKIRLLTCKSNVYNYELISKLLIHIIQNMFHGVMGKLSDSCGRGREFEPRSRQPIIVQ